MPHGEFWRDSKVWANRDFASVKSEAKGAKGVSSPPMPVEERKKKETKNCADCEITRLLLVYRWLWAVFVCTRETGEKKRELFLSFSLFLFLKRGEMRIEKKKNVKIRRSMPAVYKLSWILEAKEKNFFSDKKGIVIAENERDAQRVKERKENWEKSHALDRKREKLEAFQWEREMSRKIGLLIVHTIII